jgi:hypothetical protein
MLEIGSEKREISEKKWFEFDISEKKRLNFVGTFSFWNRR